MKKIKIPYLIVFLSIFFVLLFAGCSTNTVSRSPEELDKITLKVMTKSQLPEGIGYSIKLTNGSPFVIKQNNVYIGYIYRIGDNSNSFTEAKIEAEGNKLDIAPGEEVILNAFIPEGIYNSDKVDLSVLRYEIKGYIDEVKDNNKFARLGYDLD
ncbi:hypothetical protein LPY66_10845 [Dehalobacter sp. DCM]|uniref:hypothetical protein n=1 Tax=Dehalobacter sp. DCM TaxID=2907827 RepID=UPI003081FABB|nr:hypothetical protein LPY66_10845 [Dehalobacter sp. DCM]